MQGEFGRIFQVLKKYLKKKIRKLEQYPTKIVMIFSLKNLLFRTLASCRNPNAIYRLTMFNCAFNTFLLSLKSSVFPLWEKILASILTEEMSIFSLSVKILVFKVNWSQNMYGNLWHRAVFLSHEPVFTLQQPMQKRERQSRRVGMFLHFSILHVPSSWTKGWVH